MSKWDYMDKKVWDSSIVMKEFEKIYKESQTATLINKNTINETTKAMQGLNAEVSKFTQSMGMSADDGEGQKSSVKTKDKPKSKKKRKTKDKKVLKAQIINELVALSSDALMDLDYKLAYEVEKTIESLKNNES